MTGNCEVVRNTPTLVQTNAFVASQFSHDVVDNMHTVEDHDGFRFGKVRIAWEHELNPEENFAFGENRKPQ
jgi:hypothetical protein